MIQKPDAVETAKSYLGCSDVHCEFRTNKQGTNGGCICYKSPHIKGYVRELTAELDALRREVAAGKERLAEAEFVISGMHHLGTSHAAVNAAQSLNAYLEKYAMTKPRIEGDLQ